MQHQGLDWVANAEMLTRQNAKGWCGPNPVAAAERRLLNMLRDRDAHVHHLKGAIVRSPTTLPKPLASGPCSETARFAIEKPESHGGDLGRVRGGRCRFCDL